MSKVTIVLGSTNPVKADCLSVALAQLRKTVRVIECDAAVPHQPIGKQRILHCARKRIELCRKQYPHADAYVVIESGISYDNAAKRHFDGSYVVLRDRHGNEQIAKSSEYEIGKEEMALIRKGSSLSEAIHTLRGIRDIGKGMGASALASNNLVPRLDFHLQPMIFVLHQFFNR